MYEKIVIDNFRCFEHLEVGPLARVNLITGANNVGKTALLEAVYTACHSTGFLHIPYCHQARGLAWDKDFTAQITPLFRRSSGTKPVEVRLLFDPDSPHHEVHLELTPPDPTAPPSQRVPQWHYRVDGDEAFVIADSDRWATWWMPPELDNPLIIYLPATVSPTQEDLARRLTILQDEGRKDWLLEAARVIDPRLKDLQVGYRGTVEVAAELQSEGLVPLTSLGSGFGRVVQLMLAAGEVHPGIRDQRLLLVDEIENGIYHKAMPDVWRGIARAAREFNVQLFATTHSYECVQAAVEAFQAEEFKDDLALHRLDRLKDGRIKATTYDAEAVADAVELNWEVR